VLQNVCEPGDVITCPPDATPPPALGIELTVPAGWAAAPSFGTIHPSSPAGVDAAVTGPDGAGLVLGWTNFHVALNSDPCARQHDGHLIPDIPVGPTVDDFVDAVTAHPVLNVSEPTDVVLGGYPGKFLTLIGPSDIGECDDWRPWDPGFYVQGPDNQWDIWVVDVDGLRVLIVAQHFPGTPAAIKADLRQMAESIEFDP
jgi:hypothetical protein